MTRITIAVALILAFAVGAVAYRLAQGPIDLNEFKGWIEVQLERFFPDADVTVGAAELSWSTLDRRPVISVHDVKIVRPNRARALTIRNADINASRFGLLAGKLAPASIAFKGASIRILRSADGHILIGAFDAGDITAPPETAQTLDLVALIRETIPKNVPYLEAITLTDTSVSVYDQLTGSSWFPPLMNVALTVGERSSILSFLFGDSPDKSPIFSGFATFEQGSASVPVSLRAQNLLTSDLPEIPALSDQLEGLSLSGSTDLELSVSGRLQTGNFRINSLLMDPPRNLDAGEGNILSISKISGHGSISEGADNLALKDIVVSTSNGDLKGNLAAKWQQAGFAGPVALNLAVASEQFNPFGMLDAPIPLAEFKLSSTLNRDTGQFDISNAEVTLDRFTAQATGSLNYSVMPISANLTGTLSNLTAGQLVAIWPEQFAFKTKKWLRENVIEGTANNGVFKVATGWHALSGEPEAELTFDILDATSRYAGDLPPIENGNGRGILTAKTFELQLDNGTAGGITINKGRLFIDDLKKKPTDGDIALELTGGAADVLAFLERKPFGFPQRYGINPANASGMVTASVILSMPLTKKVKKTQIILETNITGTDLAIENVADGYSLSDGQLSFTATMDQLNAAGDLLVNDVPASIEWIETFANRKDPTTVLMANALLTDDARGKLKMPVIEGLGGTALISATFRQWFDKRKSVAISGDLTEAEFNPPLIKWSSPIGETKSLDLVVDLNDNETVLRNVSLKGNSFGLEAPEIVVANGLAMRATVSRIDLPGVADAGITWDRRSDGTLVADITGKYLNAASFVGTKGGNNQIGALSLTAAIARVRLSDALVLPDVVMTLDSRADAGNTLKGQVTFAGGQPIMAEWKSEGPDLRRFRISAQDAGSMGRALGLYEHAHGGILEINGTADRSNNADLALDGVLSVEDVVIRNAPVLAQIVSIGSLTGLRNTLNGEGIHFENMSVPFKITGETILLRESVIKGRALGLTFSGDVNRATSQSQIDGTIIPAYRTNTLLGKIPLLGDLLTGGENEGIVGINFSVRGAIDDPTITVNPLSALAPGILRKIFDARSYRSDGAQPPPRPETEPKVDDR